MRFPPPSCSSVYSRTANYKIAHGSGFYGGKVLGVQDRDRRVRRMLDLVSLHKSLQSSPVLASSSLTKRNREPETNILPSSTAMVTS